MEPSTGLRRRRPDGLDTPPRVTEEEDQVEDARPPVGTMAAVFKNSKGTELQQVVLGMVRKAGLIVKVVKTKDGKFTVLQITAPFKLMVRMAEELGLRKRDREGQVKTFTEAHLEEFTVGDLPESLFSQSEQLLLVDYVLDTIKPDKNRFDDVRGNESLLDWCKRQNYLEDCFPLHDKAAADSILSEFSIKSPLLDVAGIAKIQHYFGDQVALYFAFLNFYTKSLIWYAVAGTLVSALSFLRPSLTAILTFMFSIFGSLWAASFTTFWKRRNVEIVYMWTSLIMGDPADESYMSLSRKEDIRNEFYGNEENDRITGEKVIVYPKSHQIAKFTISAMVVLLCLFSSSRIMLQSLDLDEVMHTWLREKAPDHAWSRPFIVRLVLGQIPLAVYLACLNILDRIYGNIALRLTKWENHKYQSAFENALVFKLVLFQVLNMNMAYLYIAFVRRDYVRLSTSIRNVLLVELLTGNIKEAVVPILLARRRKKAKEAEARAREEEDPDSEEKRHLTAKAKVDDPMADELEMDPYDGVFADYFELVRQFGQITLFAAAFPLGALLAALNNFIEIYSDCFKLVKTTRRATPRRALNIGAWIRAFEAISIISIITNLGIITLTARFSESVVGKGMELTHEYFWMVVIEHLLVMVRIVFSILFEGIPTWVRDHRAKERWEMSKKEQMLNANSEPRTTESQGAMT